MNEKRLCRFEINPGLLAQCLQLPAEIAIVGARWNWTHRAVELYLEGEPFHSVGEGETIPQAFPQLSYEINQDGERIMRWDF